MKRIGELPRCAYGRSAQASRVAPQSVAMFTLPSVTTSNTPRLDRSLNDTGV
jgi:hypothetical protein